MATHIFFIDGYVGDFGYTKQFVRQQLENRKKDAVTVKISSLGGSVPHALSIFDLFKEHGNVTAELSAFVASAATLLSLGAKTIKMNQHSFYLIHKPLMWVDEWSRMNEDDIETLINNLEKRKQDLAKFTLQMAKMYVAKSGKPLDDIISLMKEETWLTAEEALEWGFIDEIFEPSETVNYLENDHTMALITANGMPKPEQKHNEPPSVISEDSLFERIWNRITSEKTQLSPNKNTMKKTFKLVNQTLGVENLEATEQGVFLNEEQLQNIEDALSANSGLTRERDQAQSDLTNAFEFFNSIDPAIASAETAEAKATAVRTLLSAKPAAPAAGNLEGADPKPANAKDADWDTINNLSHNKDFDINN